DWERHLLAVIDLEVTPDTATLHKSRTLKVDRPFSTTVIGSPEIADVLPMTDTTFYIQGKRVGTTNISVFDWERHLLAVIDLEVTPDTATLHNNIVATTGGQNINVTSANGQVVLSGEASDAVGAARAVEVAKGLSPNAPVIDAMKISPSQQVMLNVRILEVDRNAGRDLGVNWFGGNKNGIGFSGLGSATVSTTNGQTSTSSYFNSTAPLPAGAPQPNGGTFNATTNNGIGSSLIGGISNSILTGVFPGAASTAAPFGALLAQVINTHGLQIDALISALEEKGLVKTLAEPDLVALSGETAKFLAGGEIAVPVVQPGSGGSTPTVTIEWKNYGVGLAFTPTVLNKGIINLRLDPSVSELDTAHAILVNGSLIPGIIDREVHTSVELRDGQSFAIAGLLQAQSNNDISQIPWLGNLPVLGALFRSTSYQKQETDLVVIVSPHLVRPVAPGQHLATPFDTTLPANDIDLFLMGDTERQKRYTDYVASGEGLTGPYGHILQAK
ncbi:type II and III secretion system protein family protein, partial [Roseiarcus sp.]|uniref:type II and III secretion system protein family protein n=1 Tax=Roseiarcus sp. TaxID=1969460 RepID=UPI003C450D60